MKKILVLLIILASSPLVAQDNSDQNFEYALIEAQRQKMIGNLNEAVKLYMRCIDVKPESGVAHYELGSIYAAFEKDSLAAIHLEKAWSLDSKNYWYVLTYSNLLSNTGDYKKSINILKRYYRHEQDTEIHFAIAENYSGLGKDKKAMEILDEIETKNGISEIVILKKVDILKKQGSYEKGKNELFKLINIFPESPEYYILLAEYLKDINRMDEALENFETAYRLDSTNVYAITNLADHYNRNGHNGKGMYYMARAFSLDIIPLEKKMNTILYFLNNEEELKKNEKETENLVNVLLQKYPDNYDVQTVAYDYYNKTGKTEDAYNIIKQIIEKKKDSYILWQQLIFNGSILQKYQDVISYGEEAFKYFPNKKELNLFIGIAHYQLGNFQIALETLNKGFSDGYNQQMKLQFMTFIAESEYKLGNLEGAFEGFERILEIDPGNIAVMNNYSYYLALNNRDLNKAAKLSFETIKKEPENGTYQDTYGWIMFISGNYKEAERYLYKAVLTTEGDPEVLFHYAELLSKIGKNEEALTYYRKAKNAGYEGEEIKDKIKGLEND